MTRISGDSGHTPININIIWIMQQNVLFSIYNYIVEDRKVNMENQTYKYY